MEDKLLAMEHTDDQSESINSIFRAAHTIKGSAGLFGLKVIVEFTLVVESVLDRVRNGMLQLDERLVDVLLLCKDYIARMIESIEDGKEVLGEEDRQTRDQLIDTLFEYSQPQNPDIDAGAPAEQSKAVETNKGGAEMVGSRNWHIFLRFGSEVLRSGKDPMTFIRYLETLGKIENIVTLYNNLPGAAEMDPESCYLAYEISLNSSANKVLIESAFDFVREDSQIHILPPHGKIVEYLEMIEALSNEELKLGDILVRCGSLTSHELERILVLQNDEEVNNPEQRRKVGEIAVTEVFVQPVIVEAALQKQEQIRKSKDKQQQ